MKFATPLAGRVAGAGLSIEKVAAAADVDAAGIVGKVWLSPEEIARVDHAIQTLAVKVVGLGDRKSEAERRVDAKIAEIDRRQKAESTIRLVAPDIAKCRDARARREAPNSAAAVEADLRKQYLLDVNADGAA